MRSEATLNCAPLDELAEVLGAAAALEMIAQVRHTLRRRAEEIRAIADDDRRSLRISAHKLAGLAATFGLETVAQTAGQLEISDACDSERGRELDSLDREVARAIDILDAYLARLADAGRRVQAAGARAGA